MVLIGWKPEKLGFGAHYEVSLQLSTGEVVGTGFAGTKENALYFACVEAMKSERGKELAKFEARNAGFKV